MPRPPSTWAVPTLSPSATVGSAPHDSSMSPEPCTISTPLWSLLPTASRYAWFARRFRAACQGYSDAGAPPSTTRSRLIRCSGGLKTRSRPLPRGCCRSTISSPRPLQTKKVGVKAEGKPMKRSKMPRDPTPDVVLASHTASTTCRTLGAIAIAIVTLIGMATPGLTATLAEAIALHDAARDGDEDAVQPALEMLTTLNSVDPENVEVLVYLGSSYALVARYESGWFARWRNGKKGLKLLDQASERAPKNFTVQMTRAWVHGAMPKFLGYSDAALEDMLALHSIFSNLDAPSQQMSEKMVPIYERLIADAPERGDWLPWLERARQGAG